MCPSLEHPAAQVVIVWPAASVVLFALASRLDPSARTSDVLALQRPNRCSPLHARIAIMLVLPCPVATRLLLPLAPRTPATCPVAAFHASRGNVHWACMRRERLFMQERGHGCGRAGMAEGGLDA
ncbi:hypothetical protein OF83DRAFT_1179119 [Amylostereum chailletii]|nr:hypothetical protein OF83DRAFT_1179119 [Amylostereum chailletii]